MAARARPPVRPRALLAGQRTRPAGGSEFDLGKAYALRAQTEKDERIAAEKAKQEEARLRREARAKLTVLLEGKALNDANAEHARHFEYGGKIKRVHVTPEQLAASNRGELGVLQSDGRYLLVSAEVLAEAEAIFPPAIALKVDPNAPASRRSLFRSGLPGARRPDLVTQALQEGLQARCSRPKGIGPEGPPTRGLGQSGS